MPFAPRGSFDLWFERVGGGRPLLVISGTGSTLARRPNLLDAPLARQFDLVALDHRGQGRSTAPSAPWTIADYADDAVAVLDAVGWGSCLVFGVSFGGMVAQELAIRHPERVERLVLACTSSGGPGGSSYPLHELEGLAEEERLRMSLAISDTRYGLAWQVEHPDEAAKLLEFAKATSGPANADQLDARRRHDAFDRLGAVRAPTLVAAGRYDAIAPVANSEAIAAQIPGSVLQVFEGGHVFLVQDPAAFPAISEFLAC